MAHNLRLASWEPGTPASFDATPLGTYPQGRRLFLSYFCALLHFLNPYSRWCHAFVPANSLVHLEEHGSVFTRSPSLRNPYTIQFSRCYQDHSTLTAELQEAYHERMEKKRKPSALTVRFTEEEKTILAELRTYYGFNSDNDALRFALRAARRELQRLRVESGEKPV